MIKLLLVDDEAIIREGIVRMIDWARLNIRVTDACDNALSALESMTDEMPDILMTDIKMPGMDGLELVERAMTLNPELQCVILSGHDAFAFAQRAIHMGVRDYLLKPCTKEEMEQALAAVCARLEAQWMQTRLRHNVWQEKMLALAEQLILLRPTDEAGGDIAPEQVRGLAATADDVLLLREAYVFLITRDGTERLTPQWSLEAVQDVYQSLEASALYAHIAHGLTQLQPVIAARRGFVAEMVTYIHRHFDNAELSLQYLADHIIHMNADYIGKAFAQDMGMKLSAYLLAVRMEHAKRLLRAPESARMYEIAQQIGLGHNPNYFSRLFCKVEGVTPKEYRAHWMNEKKSEM